jgi:hypothetical protein
MWNDWQVYSVVIVFLWAAACCYRAPFHVVKLMMSLFLQVKGWLLRFSTSAVGSVNMLSAFFFFNPRLSLSCEYVMMSFSNICPFQFFAYCVWYFFKWCWAFLLGWWCTLGYLCSQLIRFCSPCKIVGDYGLGTLNEYWRGALFLQSGNKSTQWSYWYDLGLWTLSIQSPKL